MESHDEGKTLVIFSVGSSKSCFAVLDVAEHIEKAHVNLQVFKEALMAIPNPSVHLSPPLKKTLSRITVGHK